MKSPGTNGQSAKTITDASTAGAETDPPRTTVDAGGVADPATAPPSALSTVLGDLTQFALAPDDDGGEVLHVVQVVARRPAADEWFKASPKHEHAVDVLVLESSRDRTSYLVAKAVRGSVRANFRAKRIVVCVNRHGDFFLWPVSLPSTDGTPSPWIASAHRAVELAKHTWTRITSNMRVGNYDIAQRQSARGDQPAWPNLSMAELLASAFEGRIIDSPDHPVLRELRGED